jgi:hypothetical protein
LAGNGEFGVIKHVRLGSLLFKQKHIQYVIFVHPIPFGKRAVGSQGRYGKMQYGRTLLNSQAWKTNDKDRSNAQRRPRFDMGCSVTDEETVNVDLYYLYTIC